MKRILLCLFFVATILLYSEAFAENTKGETIDYSLFASLYYTDDGKTVYDSEYYTTMPTEITKFKAISFSAFFHDPACAIIYDLEMNIIDIIEQAQYGEALYYTIPENSAFIRIPVEKEHARELNLTGYKYPIVSEQNKKEQNEVVALDLFNGDDLPLETIVHDGGMSKIFRTIGVIGDSLSSGAMTYSVAEEEYKQEIVNIYEYSWIQYMARFCGSTAYNFSVSGMGTDTFFSSEYYEAMMDGEHLCQAYFIALGHNDYNRKVAIGTPEDIDLENCDNNADTYIGNYARIISSIKRIQPTAKIFPILMKKEHRYAEYNDAIRYVASLFDDIYLLEMDIYAVERQDWEDTLGHGNAMGYLNYAYQISSYVDWIIRHNPDEFKYVQFIGTDYEYDLGLRNRSAE